MRGRLVADLGWVGWGRYGLLGYMAGIGGGLLIYWLVLLCLEGGALARYPSKVGLLLLIFVGWGRCRVIRVLAGRV